MINSPNILEINNYFTACLIIDVLATHWLHFTSIFCIVGVVYWIFLRRLRAVKNHKTELEKEVLNHNNQLITNNHELNEKQEEILQQSEEIIQQKELLEKRNEEINQKNETLEKQKEELEKQKRIAETALTNIKDSIEYAKRIQQSILPPNYQIDGLLNDYFIYYNPCDVVSGDFYWIKQIRDKVIVAAADCTGHGVPGAFMSLLGVSALNEISHQSPYLIASEILNVLRGYVINSLHQGGGKMENKDGMDISLCIFDPKEKTLQYAGAYNPLFIVRQKEVVFEDEKNNERIIAEEFENHRLLRVKADRMPIGIYTVMKSFKNITLKYHSSDSFYLFSDGFRDQPGGPRGRKYMTPNFRKYIMSVQHLSLKEQGIQFAEEFANWKGHEPQVDDVLVMGLKF